MCINNNRVIEANDDVEVATKIVVKFLEQTPGTCTLYIILNLDTWNQANYVNLLREELKNRSIFRENVMSLKK